MPDVHHAVCLPPHPQMRRSLFVLLIAISACTASVEPRLVDRWVADFTTTRQVMFLNLSTLNGTVSGTGTLSALLGPGSTEPLKVIGTRNADTLDLLFTRTGNATLHFRGWYIGNGISISGVLSGGEFDALSVSLRKY